MPRKVPSNPVSCFMTDAVACVFTPFCWLCFENDPSLTAGNHTLAIRYAITDNLFSQSCNFDFWGQVNNTKLSQAKVTRLHIRWIRWKRTIPFGVNFQSKQIKQVLDGVNFYHYLMHWNYRFEAPGNSCKQVGYHRESKKLNVRWPNRLPVYLFLEFRLPWNFFRMSDIFL